MQAGPRECCVTVDYWSWIFKNNNPHHGVQRQRILKLDATTLLLEPPRPAALSARYGPAMAQHAAEWVFVAREPRRLGLPTGCGTFSQVHNGWGGSWCITVDRTRLRSALLGLARGLAAHLGLYEPLVRLVLTFVVGVLDTGQFDTCLVAAAHNEQNCVHIPSSKP